MHDKQQALLRHRPQPPSTLVGLPFGSTMVDGVSALLHISLLHQIMQNQPEMD